MPLFEEKLISPLAIRFSQYRIRSTFRDGRDLEESFAQIQSVPAPEDSTHDVLLDAPFPPIEVVRWRPKLRGVDGLPLEDETGEALHGEECWFTLDNRRLYCLQRAAAQALPQSAAAVVRVMYDIPTIKSIARKFKTKTSGGSVYIAEHHDAEPIATWDWAKQPNVLELDCESPALLKVKQDVATRDHRELCDAPPDDEKKLLGEDRALTIRQAATASASTSTAAQTSSSSSDDGDGGSDGDGDAAETQAFGPAAAPDVADAELLHAQLWQQHFVQQYWHASQQAWQIQQQALAIQHAWQMQHYAASACSQHAWLQRQAQQAQEQQRRQQLRERQQQQQQQQQQSSSTESDQGLCQAEPKKAIYVI